MYRKHDNKQVSAENSMHSFCIIPKCKKKYKYLNAKKHTMGKNVSCSNSCCCCYCYRALARYFLRFHTNMYNNNKICMQNRRRVLNACTEWTTTSGAEIGKQMPERRAEHTTAIYIRKYAGSVSCCVVL